MGRKSADEGQPKDWGANEVHDWGIPPPVATPDSAASAEPWDVRYDLSGWTPVERWQLERELRDSDVAFSWEGDELVVGGEDEGVVDELVGLADEADGAVDDDEDGRARDARPTALDHLGGLMRAVGESSLDIIGNLPFQ